MGHLFSADAGPCPPLPGQRARPAPDWCRAELRRWSLAAPAGEWGEESDGRWRWAVDVDAWRPRGGAWGEEFQFLLRLLPEGPERDGVLRSPNLSDNKRALVGRLLARRACARALGVADFDEFDLRRTKGGKPFLRSPLPPGMPNFNFNVSHDGRWVVLASDPLHLVGADVAASQRARGDPEDCQWLQDLRDTLFLNEQEAITQAETGRGQYAVFQRIWSAKEAVTKAVGQGLDFGLDRIEVELDADASSAQPMLEWFRDLLFRGDKPAAEDSASRRPGTLLSIEGAPPSQEDAPEAVRSPVQPRTRTGTLFIDMWPRRDFELAQHYLAPDHWVSVVLGPVEEAVDANGEFAATLRLHDIDEIRREAKRVKTTLSASAWARREPVFQCLPISALVPASSMQAYLATQAGGDEWS